MNCSSKENLTKRTERSTLTLDHCSTKGSVVCSLCPLSSESEKEQTGTANKDNKRRPGRTAGQQPRATT